MRQRLSSDVDAKKDDKGPTTCNNATAPSVFNDGDSVEECHDLMFVQIRDFPLRFRQGVEDQRLYTFRQMFFSTTCQNGCEDYQAHLCFAVR